MQRSTTRLVFAALALPLWLCSCPGGGGGSNSGSGSSGSTASYPTARHYNFYRGSFKAIDPGANIVFDIAPSFDTVAGAHGGTFNAQTQRVEKMAVKYVAYSKGSTVFGTNTRIVENANGPFAPGFGVLWDFGQNVFQIRVDYDSHTTDKHVIADTVTGNQYLSVGNLGVSIPVPFRGDPKLTLEMPTFDGWLSVDDVDLFHVRTDMSATLIASGGDIRPFGQLMDGRVMVGIDGELLLVDPVTDTFQTIFNMIEMDTVAWDASDDELAVAIPDFGLDAVDFYIANSLGGLDFLHREEDIDTAQDIEVHSQEGHVFFMGSGVTGDRRLESIDKSTTANATLFTGGFLPLFFSDLEIAANFLFFDNGDLFGQPEARAVALDGSGSIAYPGSLWAGGLFDDTVTPCGQPSLAAMILVGEPGNAAVASPLGLVDVDSPSAVVRTIGTVPVGITDVQIPRQYGTKVMATGRDTLDTNEADLFMIGADMADASADEVHRVTETPQGEFPLFTDF